MAADEIHENDIGTVFTATIKDGANVVNVSTATTRQLLFKTPAGTLLTKTAALVTDGSDGKVKYTTVTGDLTPAGEWQVQGYVVSASGSWKSDIYKFTVHPNLA